MNEFGEVVGINTAIRAHAEGIGFAIPIDKVSALLIAVTFYRASDWLVLEELSHYRETSAVAKGIFKEISGVGPRHEETFAFA